MKHIAALVLSAILSLAFVGASFATVLETATVDEFRTVQGAVAWRSGHIPSGLTQATSDVPAEACPIPEGGEPSSLDNAKEFFYMQGFETIQIKLNDLAADPDMIQMYGPLPIEIMLMDIQIIGADPRVHPELLKIYLHGYAGEQLCYTGTMEWEPEVLIEGLDGVDNPDF